MITQFATADRTHQGVTTDEEAIRLLPRHRVVAENYRRLREQGAGPEQALEQTLELWRKVAGPVLN